MKKHCKIRAVATAVCMCALTGCSSVAERALKLETVGGGRPGQAIVYDNDYKTETGTAEEAAYDLPISEEDLYYGNCTFPFLGADVMPVLAYGAPMDNYCSDKYFKDYADSGVNVMIPSNIYIDFDKNFEQQENFFELCSRYKIAALLDSAEYTDEESFAETTKKYLRYEAFAGYAGIDEPGIYHLSNETGTMGRVAVSLKNNTAGKIYYCNLQGEMEAGNRFLYTGGKTGVPEPTQSYTYEQYLNAYLENTQARMICTDRYPMRGSFPDIVSTHLHQIKVINDKIKSYGERKLAQWFYVQVVGFSSASNSYRACNYAEIAWQVNMALMYGVKGINYFTYWLPQDNAGETFYGAMVDRNGRKNANYYNVQRANEQIRAVDEYLLRCTFQGLVQSGTSPVTFYDVIDEYGAAVSIEGAHLGTGYFRYEAEMNSGVYRDVYYVVNNSVVEGDSVTITFGEEMSGKTVSLYGEEAFSGRELRVSLEAGEAVLVMTEEAV